MYEIISIGKVKSGLNPPLFSLRYENNELKSISCNRRNLQAHFQTTLWTYDFYRYVQISKKELKEIETILLNNPDDWDVLNNVYDRLFKLRKKHYDKVLDKDGILKDKYHRYSVIAHRCCNVKRSLKTVDYINQLLGVYSNNL